MLIKIMDTGQHEMERKCEFAINFRYQFIHNLQTEMGGDIMQFVGILLI